MERTITFTIKGELSQEDIDSIWQKFHELDVRAMLKDHDLTNDYIIETPSGNTHLVKDGFLVQGIECHEIYNDDCKNELICIIPSNHLIKKVTKAPIDF